MRIRVLQHVPFEDLGSMADDFKKRGFIVTTTHWYAGDPTPSLDSFDGLVIMGGPMGVYDDAEYPWLTAEKVLIKGAIAEGKRVLGICLGAQLIACTLGARVTKNPQREIGWFPLRLQTPVAQSPLGEALPGGLDVFHWHGDTFALPPGALWLASSEACVHQAFSLGDKVFGFQFHLETTEQSARALVQECANELTEGEYVQSGEQMLADSQRFVRINQMMSRIVERVFPA